MAVMIEQIFCKASSIGLANLRLLADMQDIVDWRLVIEPHDPLGARGRRMLFWCLASVSLVIGLAFYLSGAWPVVGFMGLELLVLWLAFRTFVNQQRHVEILELTNNQLIVTKIDHQGRERQIKLDPGDCRVSLTRPVKWKSSLILRQAPGFNRPAVSVRLGSALTPDARAAVADKIRTQLNAS